MTMIMKRGGAGELVSKELEISETPQLLVKADELKNISSLTISITNIYTSAESWWFSAVNSESTDGTYTKIEWKSGSGSECVYELKITDFSSYTSGIYIAGVSSTVTVKVTAEEGSASQDTPSNTETPSDTDTPSGGNSGTENGDENSSEGNESTNTEYTLEQLTAGITLSISNSYTLLVSSSLYKNLSNGCTIQISNVTSQEPLNWWFCSATSTQFVANVNWNETNSNYELSINNFNDYPDGIYIYGTTSTATVKITAN